MPLTLFFKHRSVVVFNVPPFGPVRCFPVIRSRLRVLGKNTTERECPSQRLTRGHGGRASYGLVIESFGEGASPVKRLCVFVMNFLGEVR